MKTEETPEKIYLFENPISGTLDDRWLSKRSDENDIEYSCTSAFIDKACEWIEDNLLTANQLDNGYINKFRKAMEE